MCGRYVFADFDASGVSKYFDIPLFKKGTRLPRKSYNIAPGTRQLTITRNSPNSATYMVWGFKPVWFDKPGGIINARSETVDEKPMFQHAFKNYRCLIPATGFYEWSTIGKEKHPYYITRTSQAYFAFAGIYDHHKDAGGKEHYSYAILTTTPNTIMEPIHSRMPVILQQKDHDMWLDKETPLGDVKELCAPYLDDDMVAHMVSQRVNSPLNDDASLLMEEKIDGKRTQPSQIKP